tara:strand:+ start:156 stop:326 length:171 start_codon:yes stop_codon:yes gene_type:complete
MKENRKEKQTMTSMRLSQSELESLRRLRVQYGFKSVNALIRFIATANIKIAVGIQK